MKYKLALALLLFVFLFVSCTENRVLPKEEATSARNAHLVNFLKKLGSTTGFKVCQTNPVMKPGGKGQWDGGALGSMSVLKVGDVFHMYYEAWGVRTDKEWDAHEYESLQIGHATSA